MRPGPRLRFSQVDVFCGEAFRGNPVAVVHDADHLSEEQMATIARWTNLSETTFLLTPTGPEADYRLRIFTPGGELPFAGHPTLGSAAAWLDARGIPAATTGLVQECGAGMVRVRRDVDRLAFAAPPLIRSGPASDAEREAARSALRLERADVLDAAWVDNGPGWMGLLLRDAQTVLDIDYDPGRLGGLHLGVIGRYAPGGPADYEVRAFVPQLGVAEDPVTGSLNAGFARWLIDAGLAPASYTVSQGTALQRAGRLTVTSEGTDVWVGGRTDLRVRGEIEVTGERSHDGAAP